MRFVVVYATTEGHTRKVAEHVADRLHALGQSVALHDATDELPDVNLSGIDAAFVAASLHEGRYQPGITTFVSRRQEDLARIAGVFLPVSLSAASSDADDRAALNQSVERFVMETGWRPRYLHHVMGALAVAKADFFRRWSMKLIMDSARPLKGSGIELTDWIALTELVDTLVSELDRTRPSLGLVLTGGNGTKAIPLRQPHAIGAVKGDKSLPHKSGKRPAHRLHS